MLTLSQALAEGNPIDATDGRLVLTIFRGPNCWCVRDSDPETRRLFGTNTLPTAWTLSTPVETVVRGLRRRNPGAIIRVRGGAR